MPVLFDLCYLTALAVGSPYCAYKLLTQKKIRAGMREKLGLVPRRGGGRCVWFHCVSVGEVGLARELIHRFEERFPDCPVAVSTTTDTGHAVAEKEFPARDVFYYPFDLSFAVRSTFRRVQPMCIILMELELWPNLISVAGRQNVPVAIINGRITERSFRRLRRIRFVVEPLLKRLAAISVQDGEYARRLVDLGADREAITVAGNMKYDTVRTEIDTDHPAYRAVKGAAAGQMIVGGCTWPGEDEVLLRIYAGLHEEFPGLGLTLAPRQADRLPAVERLIKDSGFLPCRLSALKMNAHNGGTSRARPGVILVDTFGELDAVYAAGDLAFVGRSLTQRGGQNILEPAALGKPVIFGPHTENFREASNLLLGADAAIKVDSAEELREQIIRFSREPEAFARMGSAAQAVIQKQKGATEKNLSLIEKIVDRCMAA